MPGCPIAGEDRYGQAPIPEGKDGDVHERVTGLGIDKIQQGRHALRHRVNEDVLRLKIRVDERAWSRAEGGVKLREMPADFPPSIRCYRAPLEGGGDFPLSPATDER